MKKARIIALCIICALVLLLLFLVLIGYFRHIVTSGQVDRVLFYTYVDDEVYVKKLSDTELSAFLNLYNLSRDAGEIDTVRSHRAYGFRIYYTDGSYQDVEEDINSKWNLTDSSDGIRRFLENPSLVDYAYELAEEYSMPIE